MNREEAQLEFLEYITQERLCQNEQWGEQTHDGPAWLSILMEEVGELAIAINDGDMDELPMELVQIAAVACAAYEQHATGKLLKAHFGGRQ
jgi:NTP pyrophosphatase (non-canonical NTP hydrolase)